MVEMEYVCRTVEEVVEAFGVFHFGTFALDVETNNELRQDLLSLEAISLYDGETAIFININPGTLEYVRSFYKSFVNSSDNTVICHNITFDMRVLEKYNISLRKCEWFDTLVAMHLIDENKSDKRLKTLAAEILGHEVHTWDEVKSLSKDDPRYIKYSIMDSVYTFELAEYFTPQLKDQGLVKLFREIEMPFMRPLLDMELNGLFVDTNKLVDMSLKLGKEKTKLEQQMYKLLGIKHELQVNLLTGEVSTVSNINLNSSQVLQRILFDELGLDIVEKSKKTGKASTGKRTINALKNKHEFVAMLEKYKVCQKLLSSFSYDSLKEQIQNDGRVRPNYRDTGTVTGRLSCNNPNIQQLPKEHKLFPEINIRDCFIAPPGKSIITADYSQQELKIAAELSRDPAWIEILENDGDMHLINANNVFNLGIDKEKLFTSHPEYEDIKSKYKKERDKGKVFSFGILYGMGPHKLSKDFNVSMEEAEGMLVNYFSGFPVLKQAIENTHKQASEELYVSTMFGRRRHFQRNQWGKLDDKSLRQSFNFLIQSAGADIIRLAAIKCNELAAEHPEYGLIPIATVHDEIVFECCSNYVNDCSLLINDAFTSVKDLVSPLKCGIGYGASYGAAK